MGDFKDQCKTMLDRTDEAFGVIYSRQRGVIFLPARTILEIDRDQLFNAGSRTLHGFFEDHIQCEIGDRKLHSPSIDVLDALIRTEFPEMASYGADSILCMKATNA